MGEADTDTAPRSLCPISLALDVVGDKWSLLILRDLMFAGKSHYRELLQSDEGISSNILAERLKRLVDAGLLIKTDDPSHKQKAIYRLTAMGIDLLPAIAQLGIWGRKYLPVTRESAVAAAALAKGGPELLKTMKVELRRQHLGKQTAE